MLSFFPRGVFDEILNLIESASEGFPSYSALKGHQQTFFRWKPLRMGTPEKSIENMLKIEQFGFSLQYDV